jgi:4-hydroxy-tetrahydrodipicolinate reductase
METAMIFPPQPQDTAPKGILVYGLGNVGQAVARLAAQRGWIIHGVNRAGGKVGRDLGELTGTPTLAGRLIADADASDLSDFGADIAVVAVHDRLAVTFDIHRRLLEAGLNVICLGTESSYPTAADPALARELDDLARAKGVTFTGCGLWDSYRIGILKTLVGPCTRLRRIHHRSVTDVNRFGPEVVHLTQVGEDPGKIGDLGGSEPSIYHVLLPQIVASLGLTIDGVEERLEPVVLDHPAACAALGKDIAPGLCAGQRTVIRVTTAEEVVAMAEIELRLTDEDEGEWMSWRIDGDPPAEIRLQGLDTGHATASSVVNRIPDVLAAPPGVVTCDRLPPMRFSSPATAMTPETLRSAKGAA